MSEFTEKQIISRVWYYTLAALTLAFTILYMILLSTKTPAMWQSVVWYIWGGLATVAIVAEITSVMMNRFRFITMIIEYLTFITSIILGFVIYFILQEGGVIATANLDLFSTLTYFPIAISLLLVFTHQKGHQLLNVKSDEND